MTELYDTHYKWECEDKGRPIGLVLKCPNCGYINKPSIKELVSGHALAPYCPNCGESMKRDGA